MGWKSAPVYIPLVSPFYMELDMAEETLKPRVSKSVLLDDHFEPDILIDNLHNSPEIARTTAEPPKIIEEDASKNKVGQIPTKSENPKRVDVVKSPEETPPQPA